MTIPSTKSEGVENVIKSLLGADRREAILADHCQPAPIGCGAEVIGFRDEVSAREYTISGLCQACQDSVFGGKPKRAPKRKATKNLIVPAPKKTTGLQKDGTFFVGGHLPMKSGAFEASKFVYKKVVDKQGSVWLYPANSPSPAEQVHVHHPRDVNSQGYDATLRFALEDGTVYDAKGPWHGNTNALFSATGIDIRNTHFTFGCVALQRIYVNGYSETFKGILYADTDWVLGSFDRLKEIAIEHATRLNHPVACYSQSSGGSSSSYEIPAGTKWEKWQSWFAENK